MKKFISYTLFIGIILSFTSCTKQEEQVVTAADRTFIQDAFQRNMLDIQKSQIVRTRGSSNQIKNFAQMLIQQGSRTSNELLTLASERDVQVAVELTPTLTQEVNLLTATPLEEFDKKYLETIIDSRKISISAHEQEIKKGKDNALREWASSKISGLSKELSNAQNLFSN